MLLSKLPRQMIASKSIIASANILSYKSIPLYSITYTRKYFQNLNQDFEQLQKNRVAQQQKKLKQAIKQIKSNDQNPDNFIQKLKIDNQIYNHWEKVQEKRLVKQCAIIVPEPKKQPVKISAVRKYILTTMKKATEAMKIVRKKYIYDAIVSLQNSQKKVAKLMVPTCYNIIQNAIKRGLDPFKLFIHGAIIGKTKRFRGVRYHAKSKSGREHRTICQVKIIVEQRNDKQFWQQVGAGQAPSGFASLVRNRLVNIQANYDQLVKMSGVTTAKGRQQKRQIIKRRVSLAMKQNTKNNIYVPKKTINKQIRQQQGVKMKQLFRSLKSPDFEPSLKRREKLFKKNMSSE